MSIYDDAGVIQIPSAYKKSASNGTLYSVVPSNGDGDFTHTRASSATRVNKGGYIETMGSNVPRLDYPLIDGEVQDCPALLLEPSRTNLATYSEDFSNWALGTRITITSDDIVSPNGSQTADKFVETTNNSNHWAENSFSATSGTSYTISMFAKANERTEAVIYAFGDNGVFNYTSAIYDLENGLVISGSGASIENYGNGWYRCIRTMTSGATATGYYAIGISNNQAIQYVGDTSKGLHIWGAQLEAGSYPTSYIKTSGSTVTRSADVCNGSGTSAEFNDSEGVLFVEISYPEIQPSSNLRISISDSSTSDRILIQNVTSTANRLQFYVIVNFSASTSFSYDATDITQNNRIALKYKENDFAAWINGFEVLTDTSGVTYPSGTLTELAFDGGDGNNDFYGKTKQLMTFKTALTDSELETLTSWDSFNAMAKGQLYTIE